MVIGADVPEAFLQQDIKKSGDGQPLLIKTPFSWVIYENNRNAESDVQSKVNTTLTKDAESKENLNKFWECDSKIELTGSKVGLSKMTWNV